MADLIQEPVSQFTGLNGTRHTIGYLQARVGKCPMLVDEWEGHGARLLCAIRKQDEDSEAQADAVIREYRVEACLAAKPLSRVVKPEEIAQLAVPAPNVSA